MNNKKINSAIVIGGGFGGISSALRLKKMGYDVTLVDNNPMLGGRAQVYTDGIFKYDAGPTVITAPILFDELFELFGKKRSDYIEFLPVKPWYKFIFSDGEYLRYGGSIEETTEEINRISPYDVDGYKNLLKFSKEIFDIGYTKLADQPFHKFKTMLKQIPHLIRLKSYLTVFQLVSLFIKDGRLRKALSFHPLLVGGNPLETTSIYCLIHYVEREWGIWYAKGGTGALVSALETLMIEENIKVIKNTSVNRILFNDRIVCGIEVDSKSKQIFSDIVVCNGDPTYTYSNLIDKSKRKKWSNKRLSRLKQSMGLFVWYFSTSRTYKNVEHHTIIMGNKYKELLDDIYNKKILSDDLSLYLHRPSATDPSMSPDGYDSFYVLAPVPNNISGIDWEKKSDEIIEQISNTLEKTVLPNFKDSIVNSKFVTPDTFENKFKTSYGSGFSIAPIFTQSAWFRFHNKSEIKNLFFTGAGTHPGAGLPGVINSAKLLEKVVPKVKYNDE
ncbi:MAG: phytoene desaturase family protein [Pontiellaceae bacterium]